MCATSQEIIVALLYKGSIAAIKSLCLIITGKIEVFSMLFDLVLLYGI